MSAAPRRCARERVATTALARTDVGGGGNSSGSASDERGRRAGRPTNRPTRGGTGGPGELGLAAVCGEGQPALSAPTGQQPVLNRRLVF